jgi:16S rRNA G1207 methylase RsmC
MQIIMGGGRVPISTTIENMFDEILQKDYRFIRYPKTTNRSLRAWNTADEHLLNYFQTLELNNYRLSVYNDRFGFLTGHLHEFKPNVIINYASQQKAILKNLEINRLAREQIKFYTPFEELAEKINVTVLRIPKSMDLFRLQLQYISKSLSADGIVLGGFMTRHFGPQMLSIASEYFEEVEQSRAWKKSRVLILCKKKPIRPKKNINSISFEDQIFRQYFGVFSSNNIDHASQFFVKNWKINDDSRRVLDLASGNGFLGKMIRLQNIDCEVHLIDDDWLAVESSKMNFEKDDEKTFFHFGDNLSDFEDDFFDLIVSNPPFHFEHENNIEVAIGLFKEVQRCLKKGGSFQLVANRHLNYKTHLRRLFASVEVLKKNKKFEIYQTARETGLRPPEV